MREREQTHPPFFRFVRLVLVPGTLIALAACGASAPPAAPAPSRNGGAPAQATGGAGGRAGVGGNGGTGGGGSDAGARPEVASDAVPRSDVGAARPDTASRPDATTGPDGSAPAAGTCGDPPPPGPLTAAALDAFIEARVTYNKGALPVSLRPVFEAWAGTMGGDAFLANLVARWPRYTMDIGRNGAEFAQAGGGGVEYNIDAWAAEDRRLPTLVHETMHNIDNGFNQTVMGLYAAAKASASKRWDVYPFGLDVPAEYMASGTEWVLLDQPFNAGEKKRARLRRMDPAFYCYLVNEFIPKVLFAPGTRYSGR